MDLIERYIYAVGRKFPPGKRPEIEKELRSRIEKMLQQRTDSAPQPSDIEAVLRELGDPDKMADTYRGFQRYLIGPGLIDIYWLVLRIVILATGLAMLLAMGVRLAVNPPAHVWQVLTELGASLYNGLLGTFALVTIAFAIVEYFNPRTQDPSLDTKTAWQPDKLPAVPASKLRIKRSDPIVALVFLLILIMIINIDLKVIGLYLYDENSLRIIPLFSDHFLNFLPWINLSLILSLIIEVGKLITRRWTIPLVLGSLVQKTIGLVIGLQMFANTKLFNLNFFTELQETFQKGDITLPANLAEKVCQVMIILIIAGFVVDILTPGIKAVRIILENRK